VGGVDVLVGGDGPAGRKLDVGAELGGYRVEALLGRGGMGVVYRAHDLALDRKVALKLLAPELAEDTHFRERFHRESRLAASLDHPSIIPIYDAGEAAGRLYIAMRLVDGTDLKRLLADQKLLKPEHALSVLGQVADALDAAHERGLVHRDVKPSNVLIDERSHCYLADFGLSRQLAEQAPVLGGARSLGTVDYVAPEQIRGDELDGRADLYSLGCMLYECLAGRPPFARGSDTAVVFAHLQEDPPALPKLEPVIAKALAKAPGDRYQSGRELIAAARDALGVGRARRSRVLVAGVVAAAAAAAALGVVLIGHNGGKSIDPTADSLVRIDTAKNTIVATTPVGHGASGVAATGRYVWVTSFTDGTVWRIDPKTHAALTIPVRGSPTGVAAGGGSVLIANGPEHSLASVDQEASGTVSYVTPLPGDPSDGLRVAFGREGAWFADASERIAGQVDQLVRGSGPVAEIPIPADETSFLSVYQAFDSLAVGEGAIWAAGDAFGRTVWRLDPVSRHVVASIKLPFVPGSIAAGDGAVWVTSLLDDTVARIDLATDRIVATIHLDRGVVGVAAGPGAVWVASSTARVVSRIDPRTNRVVARVHTTGTPSHIAAGANGVWVTTAEPALAVPSGEIGIGVLADCTGPFGTPYERSLAGAELALLHHGGRRAGPRIADGIKGARIAGKPVILAVGCADGTAASALAEARRLVEQVGVRILIGPTSSLEQLALEGYAKRQPAVAFVNGVAGAQELHPPANAFSFTPDGAASMAGLGTYAYRTLGWRRAVTVADAADSAYNWTETAGFIAEFCSLGGTIAKRIWVPSGTEDYSGVVARIPRRGVDGIVAAAGPQTVVELASRYPGLRGNVSRKLLFGVLAFPGPAQLGTRMAGIREAEFWLTSGAVGKRYVADFDRHFPEVGGGGGTAWDVFYYDAMAATLEALTAVHSDLSQGERRFMAALARVRLDSPTGRIRLDSSRQAVGPNYLVRLPNVRLDRRIDGVEHTFGGYFTPHDPPPGTTTPVCKRRTPPSWAR
jgi:ABC-type branched-subunit amino acid transport system substrate-binding protein/streptogramin lyase/predicted Ser/Thr protein kinase